MDSAQQPHDSIIIGHCLRCQGVVRVPVAAHPESTVRCPHCSESFLLYQMLEAVVPEMEVVEPPTPSEIVPVVDRVVHPSDSDAPKEFVVPPQLREGAKRRRRKRSRSKKSESRRDRSEVASEKIDLNFTSGVSSETDTSQPVADSSSNDPSAHFQSIETSPQPTTPSAGTPSSRSGDGRRDRSRRRSSSRRSAPTSTTAEMIKVILGGLLAFPTAYLVVLWVFHRDPLEIGPAIGKVAPFVVPEKLRNPDDSEPNVPSSQFDDQEGLPQLNSLDDLPSADLPSGN